MEEGDKGCPMIWMGVSRWVFLLVPAYLGYPGPKAVKRLCVCEYWVSNKHYDATEIFTELRPHFRYKIMHDSFQR